jgi:hypothetical protein
MVVNKEKVRDQKFDDEKCGDQNLWRLRMCGDQNFDDQILGPTERLFNCHRVYGNQNGSNFDRFEAYFK